MIREAERGIDHIRLMNKLSWNRGIVHSEYIHHSCDRKIIWLLQWISMSLMIFANSKSFSNWPFFPTACDFVNDIPHITLKYTHRHSIQIQQYICLYMNNSTSNEEKITVIMFFIMLFVGGFFVFSLVFHLTLTLRHLFSFFVFLSEVLLNVTHKVNNKRQKFHCIVPYLFTCG